MGSDSGPDPGGFTLLELLVVLAVLGTLSALAAPNLAGLLRPADSGDPGGALTAALRATASDAARSGRRTCLEFRDRDGAYRRLVRTGSTDRVLEVGRIDGWPGGRGPGSPVCFDASGTATPARWTWPRDGGRASLEVGWDASISAR